ncbi:hypothetical protein PoB_000370400 [Plakobranchus ocellatus]|uniref:Uncharacterized protein n=1 Tax=Plakobranchus ocellatus TaxID=259542 RepID=A0AAV3Y542_9GAST|nr:hypothetical protein PoB_000370400 [Plakobranchus ocellatus]
MRSQFWYNIIPLRHLSCHHEATESEQCEQSDAKGKIDQTFRFRLSNPGAHLSSGGESAKGVVPWNGESVWITQPGDDNALCLSDGLCCQSVH